MSSLFFQHYPEEGKLEESAYYYWYRYMQLVEGYGPKHPLWKVFGDVKSTPFMEWWCDHEDMFIPGALGVEELLTDKDIESARSEGALVVRIDPHCTRDYLRFYFEGFLDEKEIGTTAGRRKHEDEIKNAKRGFYQRPDVGALKKAFDVWELKQQKPRPSLYEIGSQLELCTDHLLEGDNDPDKADKLNVMNATVCRYYRWAKNLIANAGRGEFPNRKKPKCDISTPQEGTDK